MTSDSPDVIALVARLRSHLELGASREEVRDAVKQACKTMHADGVPPQTMLVTLKTAVQAAAMEARVDVSREMVRAVTSDLTPWMIDVCFRQPSAVRRPTS